MRASILILCAAILLVAGGAAQAQQMWVCGDIKNAFGPFDYRVADPDQLSLVETRHFTSNVEMLRSGEKGYIGGDIDYTLRAFPNHPRALMAMMNLSFKEKTDRPRGANFPVECYFMRAERFRPDDMTVKMLYGIYLMKVGRLDEALKKLQDAASADSSDPNLWYNLGLAYFDLKHYDEALKYAHKAYALGFPLPGLRNLLQKAGKWRDPEPPVAATAGSEPATSN